MHRHVPLHALAACLCALCSVLRAVPRIFQCILTLAATGLVTGMIRSIENLARQGRVPWSACLLVGCELLGEWVGGTWREHHIRGSNFDSTRVQRPSGTCRPPDLNVMTLDNLHLPRPSSSLGRESAPCQHKTPIPQRAPSSQPWSLGCLGAGLGRAPGISPSHPRRQSGPHDVNDS